MFFRLANRSDVGMRPHLLWPVVVLTVNFLILGPLAVAGTRRLHYRAGIGILPITIAGAMLWCFVALVHLPKGNEHSLSNAAACLLAIPAGAFFGGESGKGWWRNRKLWGVGLFLAFLPKRYAILWRGLHGRPYRCSPKVAS